jgi:hypothetical protein
MSTIISPCFFWVPPILKAKREAGAVFAESCAVCPTYAAGRFAGEHVGRRARRPGIRQTHRSDARQRNCAAQKARTGFELLEKRTGANPSEPHDYPTTSAFKPYPFVFAMRGGSDRFPSACEAPFVQRENQYATVLFFCQGIQNKYF